METDELFQSLIRLKENLQEISSANRLVQDTVEAYRAVEIELAPAVKALGELALEQKSLADGVQKRQLADNAEAATAHLETVFEKSQQQFAATLEKTSQSYDERSGSALQMLQAASVAITREIEAERKAIDLVKEELMGRYQALREQIVQISEELGASLGKQIADQRAYTGQIGEQLAQQLREQGATLREELVNQDIQLRRQGRLIRLLLFVIIALTLGMITLTALR